MPQYQRNVRESMADIGALLKGARAASSDSRDPGFGAGIKAFFDPDPVLQQEDAAKLRKDYPDDFASIDAAIAGKQPQQAQIAIMQLGARLASQGKSLTAIAPLMQQTTGLRGSSYTADTSPAEYVAHGAAQGEKGSTLASILANAQKSAAETARTTALTGPEVDLTRAQAGSATANANATNATADRTRTLTPAEFQRMQAETGNIGANTGNLNATADRTRALTQPEVDLRSNQARVAGAAIDPNDPMYKAKLEETQAQALRDREYANALKNNPQAMLFNQMTGGGLGGGGAPEASPEPVQNTNRPQPTPQATPMDTGAEIEAAIGADVLSALKSGQPVSERGIRQRLSQRGITNPAAQQRFMDMLKGQFGVAGQRAPGQ